MKSYNHLLSFLLLFATLSLSSCSVVEAIFKAGMGFGIFIVVAIIGLIIYLFTRGRKG